MNTAFLSAALLEAGASGIGSTISSVITWGAIIIIALSALVGMSRGMYKTAIRLVTLGLCLFLTYHASHMITDYLHSRFVGRTVEEIITEFWPAYSTSLTDQIRGVINSFDAETMERLVATGTVVLILPIVFMIVFYVLKLLSMLIYFLLHALLRVGVRKSMVSKLMGILLGAIQGAFIVWALVMPIGGIAGIAEDARPKLTTDKEPYVIDMVEGIYTDYVDAVCDNAVVKMVRGFGGDTMFAEITTVTVADETVDMQKEAIVILEIVADGYPLIKDGFNWTELREQDRRAMNAILEDVSSDEYTANTVAGVLRGIAKARKDGHFDFGFQEPFNTFMDDMIQIFSDSDRNTIEGDFRTFLDVYFLLDDAHVLTHFGAGTSSTVAEELLGATDENGTKIVTKVINKLSENPRTAPLVTSLTKFSLKLMAESVGNILPEGTDTDKIYDDVKVGMQDVLVNVNDESIPEEEKHEIVKDSLNDALVNSGVIKEDAPLNEDVMDTMTDYVMENFNGKEELTDDDINNAILSYYNQYGIPEGVNPDDINPDLIPDGVGGNTGSGDATE